MTEITPDIVLRAYAAGIFPMAEDETDPALYWVEPKQRGIIPLDQFHIPRRLAKTLRHHPYKIRVDTDFDAVIEGCAGAMPGREKTWINVRIRELYKALFEIGHCHTVEIWDGPELVGGLYGVHLGAAFFGESMFHRAPNTSKIALVHLVERLRAGGFTLLDTQFVTDHLTQFGAMEVPRRIYKKLLAEAVQGQGVWDKKELA